MKCSALNREGAPCSFPANRNTGLCLAHDPSRRDEKSANGRIGGSILKRPPIDPFPLRTLDDVRTLLEKTALEVFNSRAEATHRASAICRLAQLALDVIKAGDLQTENDRLRDFIEKHHPGAQKLLKAVP